jgi:uncharacterized protein (TIGR03083 family)
VSVAEGGRGEERSVVQTAQLLPGLHRHLMELLRGLAPQDWSRPTLAGAWTVRDVVAHLLDGQVRRLSFQRDQLPMTGPESPIEGHADLVAFLNDLNATWIRAARRLSPRVLMELLEVTGPQVAALLASLDPHGPAFFPVAWADESESESWFDVGREYTEQWHHQAQIRDAVGAPPLAGRQWLHPVLELSLRAFRRGFRDLQVAPGTALVIHVSGEAGDTWSVVAEGEGWVVHRGEPRAAAARARCDADTAWRLFFNALSGTEAKRRIATEGDPVLVERLFSVRGVMV